MKTDRIAASLLALCVLPLVVLPWVVHHWPGLDTANHLAAVHVIESLRDPQSPFHAYFFTKLGPKPYSGYYYLLMALHHVVSLPHADFLLIDVIVVGVPLALVLLVRRVAPERVGNVYLLAPFAMGWPLGMGFVGYLLAMIPALCVVALAWGRPGGRTGDVGPPSKAALVGASALLVVTCFFHPVLPLFVGLVLFTLEASRLRDPRTWLRLAVLGAPTLLYLVLSRSGGDGEPLLSFHYFFYTGDKSLTWLLGRHAVAFSDRELWFRGPCTVSVVVVALMTAARTGGWGATRDKDLGRLTAVLLFAYLFLPYGLSGWVECLTHFGVFAIFLFAMVAELPARIVRQRRLLGGFALACCVGATVVQYREVESIGKHIDELVEVGSAAPRGSSLLPMTFHFAPREQGIVGLNEWARIVLERDVTAPFIFAAGKFAMGGEAYRPLFFRQPYGESFLPNFGEYMPGEIAAPCPADDLECRASEATTRCFLRNAGVAYDRVLLLYPPQEFVDDLRSSFEVRSHVGAFWLLEPRGGRRPKMDLTSCLASPTPK